LLSVLSRKRRTSRGAIGTLRNGCCLVERRLYPMAERGPDDPRGGSLVGGWALVPPASGATVIGMLRGLGYRPGAGDSGVVEMDRPGAESIRIPLVECLRPELLLTILRTAGISASEFVAYLDEHPAP
jgi:hypothetical protein